MSNRSVGLTILCAVLLISGLGVTGLCADDWGPIERTVFSSENNQYRFEITPHEEWPDHPGHCRGVLYQGERVVWSRYLINDHAPIQVLVANTGAYVVTMDEWGSVGELPVVIYGQNGRLVKVHSTDSLDLGDDIEHIEMTISSYWWNANAISFFGPDDSRFFIRLHWGKWVVLNLNDGNRFVREDVFFRDDLRQEHERDWAAMLTFRSQELVRRAIDLLDSSESEERETAAKVCGQEKIRSAIPALKQLLADDSYNLSSHPQKWTRVYYVRKAALFALREMGEVIEGVEYEVAGVKR